MTAEVPDPWWDSRAVAAAADEFDRYLRERREAERRTQAALRSGLTDGDAVASAILAQVDAYLRWRGGLAGEGPSDPLDRLQGLSAKDAQIAEQVARASAGATPTERREGLLTVRTRLDFRVGELLEARWPPLSALGLPEGLVVHSTPPDHATGILSFGGLLSFTGCAARGVTAGPPPGQTELLDPPSWLDYVFFGPHHPRYLGGEQVANAHLRGRIDWRLATGYQPSVRFVFRERVLEDLAGGRALDIPRVTVRDFVPLDLVTVIIFPDAGSRDRALARAVLPDLHARCLISPDTGASGPVRYVAAAVRLAARFLEQHVG